MMIAKKAFIILAHAFLGWVLCGSIMGIGLATVSEKTALVLHAIGAPIFFALITLNYFRRFHYTEPLLTALIFMSFIIVVDFFVVALMINKSLEMFSNPLGTWIPFTLIFLSTYVTGILSIRVSGRRRAVV